MSCVHLAACSLTWAELYCTDEWWTHCARREHCQAHVSGGVCV
jgi:hypothetical protein